MITSETLTDATIREVMKQALAEGDLLLVDFCRAALGNPPWTDWTPTYCRVLVADRLNARSTLAVTIREGE